MKRHTWKVDTYSTRPAGRPDECFYCKRKLGQDHKEGCVIRSRTVMVRVSFDLIVDVPEDWERSSIEFHMNESSSCKDNLLDKLEKQAERLGCSCDFGEGVYLREATAGDEEAFKMKIADAEA
jgi:hypothetical protein